jgi:hypothetical protein
MGRRGTVNSPKGIFGSDGDQSSARDGVPLFLKLGDNESVLQWSSDSSKTTSSFPLVLVGLGRVTARVTGLARVKLG